MKKFQQASAVHQRALVNCCLGLAIGSVLTLPAHAAGNPAKGKVLAQTCVGCHGVQNYDNVYPTFHVPKLGGQSPDYLVAALKAYQTGKRKHATMRANVTDLSARDIDDIVAYITSSGATNRGNETSGNVHAANH